MSVSIPSDWNGTDYETMSVTVPKSTQWRAIIKGVIAQLDDDYAWQEADDTDLDNAIAEVNQALDTIAFA